MRARHATDLDAWQRGGDPLVISHTMPMLLIGFASCAGAQGVRRPVRDPSRVSFATQQRLQGRALLKPPDTMSVGVFYYPEQWPRAQWARGMTGMATLGFQFVHLAEFSWTSLEPAEGRLDFAWLDSPIARAHDAGLRVVLGTPSAAPPS